MKCNTRMGFGGIISAVILTAVAMAAPADQPGARKRVRTRAEKTAAHAVTRTAETPPRRVAQGDFDGGSRAASRSAVERTKSVAIADGSLDQAVGPREAPANDACAGAEDITGEGTFAYDSTETLEAGDGPEHTSPIPYGCVDVYVSPLGTITHDLWYCWTSTHTGPVRVDTCESPLVDTKIAVYNECTCLLSDANLFIYGCVDDALGDCGVQSAVTFPALSGQSYMIRIGTYPGDGSGAPWPGGPGEFMITYLTPPCTEPADDCQDAPAEQAEVIINSNGLDFLAADDFTPAETGIVSEVCWWGAYVGVLGGDYIDCQAGTTDEFVIRYYADAGGIPGTLIAGPFTKPVCSHNGSPCLVDDDCKRCSLTLAPCLTDADCLETETCEQPGTCTDPGLRLTVSESTATGYTSFGFREFEYAASHAPVAVNGGECYWVEISNALEEECSWFWEGSLEGNDRSYQDDELLDPPTYQPFELQPLDDLAFCVDVATADVAACSPPAPANDNCANSSEIFDGLTDFDTSSATTDGPSEESCNFTAGTNLIEQDIWFDYVATCSEILTVDLCGSIYDTRVAVYDGDGCPPPNGGNPLGCNDDACGPGDGLQSKISVPVTQGQAYKIRVGGYGAWFGTGMMLITCSEEPPGACETSTNDCCLGYGDLAGPGCSDQACCERVCAVDSFCCDDWWDADCAFDGFYGVCSETLQTCTVDANCPVGETCSRKSDALHLCSACFPCPNGDVVFLDPPSNMYDARQPHPLDDGTSAQGYDVFIIQAPVTATANCWTICESDQAGTNTIVDFGPNMMCSGSGSQCDTTADCNACDDNGQPCVTSDDCKTCFITGEPCKTVNDCVPFGQACGVSGACIVSGEVCLPDGNSRVRVDHQLMPGALTTLTYQSTYLDTIVTGRFTALPGDVNGIDGTNTTDLAVLIGCLNGGLCSLRMCDLDRQGVCVGADLERLVDLLNGAGEYQSWNQRTVADDVVCPADPP